MIMKKLITTLMLGVLTMSAGAQRIDVNEVLKACPKKGLQTFLYQPLFSSWLALLLEQSVVRGPGHFVDKGARSSAADS